MIKKEGAQKNNQRSDEKAEAKLSHRQAFELAIQEMQLGNHEEAANFLRMAARANEKNEENRVIQANARKLLGEMHIHGIGAEINEELARRSFATSSILGNEDAKQNLELLQQNRQDQIPSPTRLCLISGIQIQTANQKINQQK